MDSPNAAHGHIPAEEAEQRCHYAQEEQVAPNDRLAGNDGEVHRRILQESERQCGDETPEEQFARDEKGGPFLRHTTIGKGIERPAQTACQREKVAQRIQFQQDMPVHHHAEHTDDSQQTAQKHARGKPRCLSVQHPHKQHGVQRCEADYKTGVCGQRVLDCRVFRQKIERAARYAQKGHPSLVLPRGQHQMLPVERQQHAVCQSEAEQQDVHRRQPSL